MQDSSKSAGNNHVLRLNNDYTNQQLQKQRLAAGSPKRKYLGLILITVIIVLTIPTYGLIQSFQTLQKVKVTETKITSKSETINYQASSQAELIKNMHNKYYVQKFARGNYGYTKKGEKVFMPPGSSVTGTETDDDDN